LRGGGGFVLVVVGPDPHCAHHIASTGRLEGGHEPTATLPTAGRRYLIDNSEVNDIGSIRSIAPKTRYHSTASAKANWVGPEMNPHRAQIGGDADPLCERPVSTEFDALIAGTGEFGGDHLVNGLWGNRGFTSSTLRHGL
jgi:hypothetical protein